eukprot:scaffold2619_cov129-Cylindrotheca_fusiformis.AAC.10
MLMDRECSIRTDPFVMLLETNKIENIPIVVDNSPLRYAASFSSGTTHQMPGKALSRGTERWNSQGTSVWWTNRLATGRSRQWEEEYSGNQEWLSIFN